MKSKQLASKSIMYIIAILVTSIVIFPLLWMVLTALKAENEILQIPMVFFPEKLQWRNLIDAFQLASFDKYILNSAIVSITATVITVFINMLAGFAFAKYDFKGKNILFFIVLCTLMIPIQVNMVPLYLLISKTGWQNSYLGLIVPTCAEAFGLFLARQFITDIPDSLLESMRMDGAGEFKIFLRCIVPNCRALMSVLTIFTFMWRWNDFVWPLLVVKDEEYFTIQMGLNMLIGQYDIKWNQFMAASFISTIPILVIFLIFQKQFIQGVAMSGMKE